MPTKKLAEAEKRLELALDANAPAAAIDLLRLRVEQAGGNPNSVVPADAGDVTRPSNPLALPLSEQDIAIIRMQRELQRRMKVVADLKAEQAQVEADLLEIQEELDQAEAELDEFTQREMNRRDTASEPLDAA